MAKEAKSVGEFDYLVSRKGIFINRDDMVRWFLDHSETVYSGGELAHWLMRFEND